MITFASAILAFVTVQRLAELVYAKRNTAKLLARGAREEAPAHYPLIVVMHAAWIVGLWWLAWNAPVNLFWFAIFVVLQCLRLWVLATLGERWTTKIIVLPGAEPIRTGPFRFLNHPNYAVVIAEIAVLCVLQQDAYRLRRICYLAQGWAVPPPVRTPCTCNVTVLFHLLSLLELAFSASVLNLFL